MKQSMSDCRVFGFGCGYVALALARELGNLQLKFGATTRTPDKHFGYAKVGLESYLFDSSRRTEGAELSRIERALSEATHILVTIPPNALDVDPVYKYFREQVLRAPRLRWFGYVSSAGVYGNKPGRTIDEEEATEPVMPIDALRLEAERSWLDLFRRTGIPVHVFRMAAFYGPNRSQLDWLREDAAHRIDVPGVEFSRVHIDDVAKVLLCSMRKPAPGSIYNVSDDLPCPPGDVVDFAYRLLGKVPPASQPKCLEDLPLEMRAFYGESRRLANEKMKRELAVSLTYPTYREGLSSLVDARQGEDIFRPPAQFDETLVRSDRSP